VSTIVHAYRWGDREQHSYHVGVFDTEKHAMRASEGEEDERRGIYRCEIYRTTINNNSREFETVKDLPR